MENRTHPASRDIRPTATVGQTLIFYADHGWNVYDVAHDKWTAAAKPESDSFYPVGIEPVILTQSPVAGHIRLRNVLSGIVTDLPGQLKNQSVGTIGTKIVQAGGLPGLFGVIDDVDTYDQATRTTSHTTLSAVGDGQAIATLGTEIFIGGGLPANSALDVFTDLQPSGVIAGTLGSISNTRVALHISNEGDDAIPAGRLIRLYGSRIGHKAVVLVTVTLGRALRVGQSRDVEFDVHLSRGKRITDYRLMAASSVGSEASEEQVFAGQLSLEQFTTELSSVIAPAAAGKAATFTVAYHTSFNLDEARLDDNDIIVTGPNGFEAHATFLSSTRGKVGSTTVATYAIHAPGNRFDSSDNGRYVLHLQNGEVLDAADNAPVGRAIGSFTVAMRSEGNNVAASVSPTTPFQSKRRIESSLADVLR